jgi:hypothetical protein
VRLPAALLGALHLLHLGGGAAQLQLLLLSVLHALEVCLVHPLQAEMLHVEQVSHGTPLRLLLRVAAACCWSVLLTEASQAQAVAVAAAAAAAVSVWLCPHWCKPRLHLHLHCIP